MNILITGANGQLGNEMRVLSKENGQHAYFFTDVQELDICDEQAVHRFVKGNRIDVIVNCAAYTAVDKAEDNQELCDKLNHVAPGYLAAAAEACGAALIQVSTDYVFDGTGHTPYTEEAATCPNSVYGSTKLAGEQAVMKHCSRAMIIRTAWLYSQWGKNFVKTMLEQGKRRKELRVVCDQIGTPTYTADLAKFLANLSMTKRYGIYHVTNEGEYVSWYDFAKEIFAQAVKLGEKEYADVKVIPVTTAEYGISKAARPFNSRLDRKRICEEGFQPLPVWKNALEKYLQEVLAERKG